MGQEPVRAADVIGAMSIATDLGTGQPLEHALRTAILAARLGELAELSPPELVDAYYISLLHSFGCTSDATEQTELFRDDSSCVPSSHSLTEANPKRSARS